MENKETQEKVTETMVSWDPSLDLFILNKVYVDVASAENETALDMI